MDIHPVTVHFTVGLLITALALEFLGALLRRDTLRHAGWWSLVLSAPAAVASVLSGRLAAANQPHAGGDVHAMMEAHELRGFIVLGFIILLVLLRALWLKGAPFGSPRGRGPLATYLIAFLVAGAVLFAGAKLGGEMVYEYGVGVRPVIESMAKEQGHDHDHDNGH